MKLSKLHAAVFSPAVVQDPSRGTRAGKGPYFTLTTREVARALWGRFPCRSKCEQWIREGKCALSWTRLSCNRFPSSQVRLAPFVLAYNLGNFLRRFALPRETSYWSLRSVQLKLIKIGAKVVSQSRSITFQCAEVAIS